ncbi:MULTISPECIES: hypothetical protein [Sphingobacterium]|uniref:hypothetical protein n=1 Tax=Sphingobacterium TaxID=28453 RepID=UPI002580E5AE|nr:MULTISPECIES: hypothetical protein [Sphingobacterium]
MKRYLLFIALLGLGFGACKKEQAAEPDQDSFVLKNERFSIEETKKLFSILVGLPKDDLTFVKDSLGFRYKNIEHIHKIEPFMEDLKELKKNLAK